MLADIAGSPASPPPGRRHAGGAIAERLELNCNRARRA
jgi:hypothetical protein